MVALALVTSSGTVPTLAGSDAPRPMAILDSPVQPIRVLRLFDPPPQPWNAGHRGIDLATQVDAPVHAPADGLVTFAGWVVDRSVITITHSNGLRSSMEPVVASVEVGQWVSQGQVIGAVESGDHCVEACVHWGIRHDDRYLNPLDWLIGFGPVRLLPLLTYEASGQ